MRIPLDEFGLRVGSARSKAAAMYARGATAKEVMEAVGQPHFTLLRELKWKGYIVATSKVLEDGHRLTKYTLIPKTGVSNALGKVEQA